MGACTSKKKSHEKLKEAQVKIAIIFHSYDNSVYSLATAAAEGAQKAGIHVELRRIRESLSKETILNKGILYDVNKFEHIKEAEPEELQQFNGYLFGGPVHFGTQSAQLKSFIDALGSLWVSGSLIGKPVGSFTSGEFLHGGQETEILLSLIPFLHLGMIIVGLPYSFQDQSNTQELHGVNPYGCGAVYKQSSNTFLSNISIRAAQFQGEHIANITKKIIQQK